MICPPHRKGSYMMKFINIGFGNMVASDRIITIVSPDSAPVKRLIQDAKDSGRVIDVSCGRRTRSVIITDSEHVILSAIQSETIANRLESNTTEDDEESEEYRCMALDAVHAIAGRIPYFEVNVGAIARGYKSVPYPAPFLAREMLDCGMGAVIGTDCHHPEFLFENVDLGIELLRSVGAREVFVLREGGFEPIKI